MTVYRFACHLAGWLYNGIHKVEQELLKAFRAKEQFLLACNTLQGM